MAQPLERQRYMDRDHVDDPLPPPSVSCPDQQTLDEWRRYAALAIGLAKQSPGAHGAVARPCVHGRGLSRNSADASYLGRR
jgi:hypothetical protein